MVAGNGGICRVARLIARVVSEHVLDGRLEGAFAATFGDAVPATDVQFPVRACGGSRIKFAARCSLAKITNTHAIYDCIGLAAAHLVMPYPRRPFLAYLHGIEVWEGWAKPKYARTADRAALLVTNSAYTRERASKWHPPLSRASVCWLGTEDDLPAPPAVMSGPPRVTIIARMDTEQYKGHTELIEAWPKIRTSVPDAVLTIVGRGPAAAAHEALARKLDLSPSVVEFRGFVPESDLPGLWAETTVFAMPSRGEGFGLVYIEAMRNGRPVVASIHDAAPEINIDGKTGFNVNLDKQSELADAIVSLLSNQVLCDQFGVAGRDRWAQHFRYSSFRKRFAPLIQELLAV